MLKSKLITAAAVAVLAGSLVAADAFAAPRGAPTSISRGSHNGPNGNGPNSRPNDRPNDRPNGNNGNGNRINIGNDVDIDIDTDPDWDHDHHYHPVATAVAVSAVVAVGTRVYVLPTGCTTSYYGGVTYSYCGSSWYRPYYSGTTVYYVVVARPY